MCLVWETPPNIDIVSEPYEEDPLSLLGNAIIRRIQNPGDDLVMKITPPPRSMMGLKPREML
jgi:hypothetical protein